MRARLDLALAFPPGWYFHAVPADLTYAVSFLAAAGAKVHAWDLNAATHHALLGDREEFRALRERETYLDPDRLRRLSVSLLEHAERIGERFGVGYEGRTIDFGSLDTTHVPAALAAGLDPDRNPALPVLGSGVREILAARPRAVAVALVHPEQIVHCLALGGLLREGGFEGDLVVFGALEDVLTPEDLAPDLVGEPTHLLFRHFDGVVIGEAETALATIAEHGLDPPNRRRVPNLLRPGNRELPTRHVEALDGSGSIELGWVRAEHYLCPRPVVDLRLGRGCPWGKCAFCAIQAHHTGYRATDATRVARAAACAAEQLGTRFFRLRDDLLTPPQLRAVAGALAHDRKPVAWTARARFQPGLDRETLADARAGGLEELWLGLESAVPEVRDLMVKGVAQADVERIITDAHSLGLRLRPLCLLGFPGETRVQAEATVRFLAEHASRLAGASLTRFILTRRSPVGRDPRRFGIVVGDFPHPRHQRLSHTLPANHVPGMARETLDEVYRTALEELFPLFYHSATPYPSHAWVSTALQALG